MGRCPYWWWGAPAVPENIRVCYAIDSYFSHHCKNQTSNSHRVKTVKMALLLLQSMAPPFQGQTRCEIHGQIFSFTPQIAHTIK